MKLEIEIDDTEADLISVLAEALTANGPPFPKQEAVARVIQQLVNHAQQGVYRPGAWERSWISQIFPVSYWEPKLEPGNPWNRKGCESIFCRPKTSA